MSRVSIKGVVIGVLTSTVMGMLLAMPIVIYLGYNQILQGATHAQLNGIVNAGILASDLIYILTYVIGVLGAVIGGYVSARIAKHHEILNGAFASTLGVGFKLYMLFFGTTQVPLWHALLAIPLNIAFAALGGYLRLRQVRAQSHSA